MKRRHIIAGNWKMNTTLSEGIDLIQALKSSPVSSEIDIILCPPFTHLETARTLLKNSGIHLGAQTLSEQESGAFTGEISASMLASVGVKYVIIGHSERRTLFHETNSIINAKLKQAIHHRLNPIFCIGESLNEREENLTFSVLSKQLIEGLSGITPTEINTVDFVVAYEPIWAIGTGKTASPEQAQDVHAHIRSELTTVFGKELASKTRIQYGGSVKPDNCQSLLSKPDIDGALVGGACLKAESFLDIINSHHA